MNANQAFQDPLHFYNCPRCYRPRPSFRRKNGLSYTPIIPLKFGPEHTRAYLRNLKPIPRPRERWVIVPDGPRQLTLF